MRGYETTVRGWADVGGDVLYSSTPIYEENDPHARGRGAVRGEQCRAYDGRQCYQPEVRLSR